MKVIVSTAGRPDLESRERANFASVTLGVPYKERKKRSVSLMIKEYGADVLIAGKNRFEYYTPESKVPFFFHPNSAAFRLKRLEKGEEDPFISSAGIREGDTVLDCTLGIGSDSIVASYVSGAEGRVVGCEAHPVIAFVVKEGMMAYKDGSKQLLEAIRRVEVIPKNSLDYLKELPDQSIDVVYMDPMFEEEIEESSNFQSLRAAGYHTRLSEEWINEAKRVAKRCVVLKAHFRSRIFEQYGFKRIERLTSKFHYGVIEV